MCSGTTAPTVELPVPGRSTWPTASLTVVGAHPSQLPALRAATAVVGLVLTDAAADPDPDPDTAPAAGLAYRLTQAVAQPGASACRADIHLEGPCLVVQLEGGAPLAAAERWTARACALGGDLVCLANRLQLTVPIPDMRTP